MEKERLTMFSDGVIAIIITIMVLELKAPHGAAFADLVPLWPVFLSYVLSFIYVAIYWTNHHHLFQTVKNVTGGMLWANINLLFWLSLIPFTTAWAGENHFATLPTAVYGLSLLLPALAWPLLQFTIIRSQGSGSMLAKAIGRSRKEKLSLILYVIGIGLAFVDCWMAYLAYSVVAIVWLVPDKRIEKVLGAG